MKLSSFLLSTLALTTCVLSPDAAATDRGCLPATIALVPGYDITTWPPAPFRWRDIGTNLYAESYRTSYAYDQAEVAVVFDSFGDSVLAGRLDARGLKPNFAYQTKLVGKPTSLWGALGDDWANERIGYAGRWWRKAPTPGNSSDAEYEAHKDDPEYIFEGYLLFDFFLTDRDGSASLEFLTNSSYHVLWWEQQRTPGACDGPVKGHTVVGYAADEAYDLDVGPTEVGVYAEIERLCPGLTVLPDGVYRCRFLLTEESFHQSGDYQGYWASALVCDTLVFTLTDIYTSVPREAGGEACLLQAQPNPFRGETRLCLGRAGAGRVDVSVYDVAGRLVRTLASGAFAGGDAAIVWDGRDSGGRPSPAGVYFYRVSSESGARGAARAVLLR